MERRLSIGLVACLVAAQVALGSFAAASALTNEVTKPSPAPRSAAKAATTAIMRQTAESQARLWRWDATLILEVSWLSWPQNQSTASHAPVNGWSTFVFASGGDRLAIVVDRGSGFVLGQHVQPLGLDTGRSLDPAALQITAEVVSSIAEVMGGQAYRAVCPAHRDLSKIGASLDANGTPIWVATYADDRTPDNPDVTVVVNAKTGAVERSSVSAPPCEQN